MKRLLQCMFLFGILFVTGHAVAQDVITLKDGTDVKAKVIEITTNDVKYKNESNPDGPTYTLSKADILMIRYKNGDKDIFTNTNNNTTTTNSNTTNNTTQNSNAAIQTSTSTIATTNTIVSDDEEILNIGGHGFSHLGFGWAGLTGDDAKDLGNTLGGDCSFGISFKPIIHNPDFLLNFVFRPGVGERGYSYENDDYVDIDVQLSAFNLYISPFELNGTLKLNQSYLNGFFGFYGSVDIIGESTTSIDGEKEEIRLRDFDNYNRWDFGILLGGSLLLFKNSGISTGGISISYKRGFVSMFEKTDGFTSTLLIGYTTRF